MSTEAVILWTFIAAWGFMSYIAWRHAARRGLYGPMVNICAVLCPVVLFFMSAHGSGAGHGKDSVCRTCYRRGCVEHRSQ
jgi:hypothetical protein